jgi:hypothetical protein
MKITADWLLEKNACAEGRDWFTAYEGKPDGTSVVKALMKADKLDWANWLIVRVMTHKQRIAYAIYAAEQVIGIYEKKYPDDKRPRLAIEAAKEVLNKNTEANKKKAADAADAAAYAAYAAADAAYAANAADAANAAYAERTKMKIKILKYGIKLLGVKK